MLWIGHLHRQQRVCHPKAVGKDRTRALLSRDCHLQWVLGILACLAQGARKRGLQAVVE